jgi:ribosome-associated translation inhibitor RaiA
MNDARFRDIDKRTSPPMRIHVLGEDTIGPQARTYAEYRVFAALTQLAYGERVRHARVVLRRATRNRGCDGVTCTVTVAFAESEPMRIRVTGDHEYAAINRAVERLRAASVQRADRASVERAQQWG